MTVQEAIDLIKQVSLYRYECELEKGRQSDLYEALYLAIEALEKQILKKQSENIVGYYCTECKRFFEGVHNYCENCGQAIDWSE